MLNQRLRVSIAAEFQAGGRRAKGLIKNISKGGIFVRTNSIPETGENVDLSFKVPRGGEVSLSGVVWWTTRNQGTSFLRPHGFGVRLLGHDLDLRQLLPGAGAAGLESRG